MIDNIKGADMIDNILDKNRPFPELLRRDDIVNAGGWEVVHGRAVRGEPGVTIRGRTMRVPLDGSELSQAIRAHEMMHVKITPADGFSEYVSEYAGIEALTAAEEARVQLIAAELKFPMKALITGSEKHDGATVTKAGDWATAVFSTAATLHTGSLKLFISGVRSVSPSWANTLRDISKEMEKFQRKQLREIKRSCNWGDVQANMLRQYGSTDCMPNSTKIVGMMYTVELAMLLESIASMPAPPLSVSSKTVVDPEEGSADGSSGHDAQQDDEQGEGSSGGNAAQDDASDGQVDDAGENASGPDDEGSINPQAESVEQDLSEKKANIDRQRIQDIADKILRDRLPTRGLPTWQPLLVGDVPLVRSVAGALSYRKIPSMYGRSIVRVDRLWNDPQQRVFSRKVRANGGVVLVDCSGSMKLSKEDLEEILRAAPGCLVLGYSASGFTPRPNMFVLAKNGSVAAEMPRFYGANGNDLPAIQYAVANRGHRSNPVIWVTDGLIYTRDGMIEAPQRQCAEFALANKVHMEYDPAEAIRYLQKIKNGARVVPQLIENWRDKVRL